MQNEQKTKNTSANAAPEEQFITTEEKAQYEVFRNGSIPRETIAKWVTNDLKGLLSFVSGVLRDDEVREKLVDAFYDRYKKLHANQDSNVEESPD